MQIGSLFEHNFFTMNIRQITFIAYILFSLQNLNAQDSLLWKFTTAGAIYSSAAISGNTVFFGSGDMNLYSLNKTTGEIQWTFLTSGAVHSTPAVYNESVYFSSKDGNIYSVSEKSGKLNWIYKTRGEQTYDIWDYYISSPIIENGIVYIGSGDSCMYALDAQSGKCVWKYKTNGIVHASPVVSGGMVYIGSYDGYFYALHAADGKLKWKFKTRGNSDFPLGEIQRGAVFFKDLILFGSRDYSLYVLDIETGTEKWKKDEPGSWIIATPLVYGNNIYFGTSDSHRFHCMDAQTAELKWTLPLNMRVYGTACCIENNIVFGCFNGKLYFVNSATGEVMSVFQTEDSSKHYAEIYTSDDHFRSDFTLYGEKYLESEKKILSLGSILSDPVAEGDTVYFGDANGNFYSLRIHAEK